MDSQQLGLITQAINRVTAVVTSTTGGLSTKVPYTGANQAVNLGTQTLTSGPVTVMAGTIPGGIQIRDLTTVPGQFAIYSGVVAGTNNYFVTGAAGDHVMNSLTITTLSIAGIGKLDIDPTSLTFRNNINIITNTSTGTKICTATNQKIAFWNKTPIVQPTTGIAAAAFVANTSLIANDTATFGGYTIGQIAAALINTGILA